MKYSDEYKSPKDALYAEVMAEQLRAVKREKRPVSVVQCASTQAIIDRDPALDKEHWNRSIPLNWKANPNAKTLDEAVGMKTFDPAQLVIADDLRRQSKNTLGDAVSQGASSVTVTKKEKAIAAFQYSKPTPLTTKQKLDLIAMISITPPKPELKVEKKLNWFQRLFKPKDVPAEWAIDLERRFVKFDD